MRRLLRPLLVLGLLLGSFNLTTGARAQVQEEEPPPQPLVALRLRSQTPWNDPKRPLRIVLEATNHSTTTLDALSIVLSIQAPARSRSVYELSLRSDATPTLEAQQFLFERSLAPGQTRAFRLDHALDAAAARGETAIYPLRVDLLSGDAIVGTLRTPLIFLTEDPEVPLNVAWTWVLTAPIQYRPDGVFLSGSLESDVAPEGRLDAMVAALNRVRGSFVDVAVSPVLLDQLSRMASGYRSMDVSGTIRFVDRGTGRAADAARLLEELGEVVRAPSTELVSVPFGDPNLPALVASPLVRDLRTLLEKGRESVESFLAASPRRDLLWPPDASLDQPSVTRLRRQGVRAVIVGPHLIPAPDSEPFSPSPVVRLGGPRSVVAVVSDEEIASLLRTYRADARLAAQATLGKLAATWLEFPGTPGRGAAIALTGDPSLPPLFYGSLVSRILNAPWLRSVTASGIVALTPERDVRPLPDRVHPAFNPAYVERILRARASVAQFAATAEGVEPMVERLVERLLLADAGTFVQRPDLGSRFIEASEQAIRETYAGVRVIDTPVTLASRDGTLVLTLANDTGLTLRVRIRLVADRRIAFVNGSSRIVTLPPERHTLEFPVRAETTGRFPIHVQVLTPFDPAIAETITASDVLIRSTAYNRVALFLTIGAAVFLVGWWGRRFLPRRRS